MVRYSFQLPSCDTMTRTSQIQRELGHGYSIRFVNADGDCFYSAMAQALPVGHSLGSVAALRALVAASAQEETLELLRVAHIAGVEGFEWVGGIADLEALRARLCLLWKGSEKWLRLRLGFGL